VVALVRRERLGQAIDRRRRRGDDAADIGLDRRLEDVEAAVDEDLVRQARLLRALRDPDGGEVEDGVDASIRRRTSARSQMSPSTTVTCPFRCAQARFSRRPRTKLSRTTTSSAPESTSSSTTFEPMAPAPPVTSIRPSAVTSGPRR